MASKTPETINQRFGQLIQQLGLNKNAFAQSLGKTASVIQHLMDGRNKPGYDLLYKVFEVYPNVSRDWLMLGKGPMMLTDSAPAKEEARSAIEPISPPAATTQEALDFDEPVIPSPRRPAARTPLQPAGIAATLTASAAGPIRSSAPLPQGPPVEVAAPTPTATPPPMPASAPAPPVFSPAPAATPDASLALALQTQHLQHQLALAELRNQHLLEQQQMLREMLTMAHKLP